MFAERELRSRRQRPPVNYQQSDDDDDDDDPHDDDYAPHDDDYAPYDDDDDADDSELTDLRATQGCNMTQKACAAEAPTCHLATPRARRAEAQKRYRARHRERVAEAKKRYREQHRNHIAEVRRRYWENNREQLLARQQRYREAHRELLREKQRQRDARRRELLREQNRIRRARFREKKRTAKKWKALGPLTLTIPLVWEAHPELLREKIRTREKLKALGPLRLTIPLTDCLKSVSVTAYVKAFCDSLDSVDTNVPPAESFVQLLEEDGPTLLDLDSGTMQVSEPSDCDDLSFLQDLLKDMSADEWEQVMDDVEESVFDLEALVPPQGINDWLEDMTSSDEGVDLMYDLVS